MKEKKKNKKTFFDRLLENLRFGTISSGSSIDRFSEKRVIKIHKL